MNAFRVLGVRPERHCNCDPSLTLRDRNEEYQRCDAVKDVEPLASLGTLSSDVKELVRELADPEVGFSGRRQQQLAGAVHVDSTGPDKSKWRGDKMPAGPT